MAITPTGENFSSGAVVDATPYGWTTQATPGIDTTVTNWFVRSSPSWASGRVARGTTLGAPDNYLTKTFSQAAGSGDKIRFLVGTDQSPITTRNGNYLFYSGTSAGFAILFLNTGVIQATNMATAPVTVFTPYVGNTLYDIKVAIGAAGAISSVDVNGTVTNSVGTMLNSLTSVNTIRVDSYNGGLTPTGHAIFDALCVDTSTAPPNGTLAASGILDFLTLGPNMYGEIVLGYTNGSSAASTIYKLERSADLGVTWATIPAAARLTASGFFITDGRPSYGAQPVANGNTATYRVTAMNATGNQVL